jgi:AraC family transcriptional activator of tynA and feaB
MLVVQTWTTQSVAAAGQFAYWRELVCEVFLDLTPESERRDRFTGVVTHWPFGEVTLARIESQPQRVLRTGRDIERTPRGGYYANLQIRGTSTMRQNGRTTVLSPGDFAVAATDRPFEFAFGSDFRQLSLFIPAPLLHAQLSGPVPTATRIDTSTGVGASVRHAMVALARSSLATPSAVRLATLAGGLLAVALEPATTEVDRTRSARSYRAALADIAEHLTDDDLSPAATANRLGISVRWLHGLFVGQERSYAGTVRRLRLEMASRTLRDPARGHLRVIDIAAEAGFGDVSSFHRAFRREFGQTPAQVRRLAAH